MPITQDDVRFRASQRMTDFPDGGGPMSTTVIVDGVDNNLFDDVTDIDRLSGVLSLRKVYGAVLNADSAAYLSAHALLDVPPSDPATSAFIMATGGVGTERAAAHSTLAANIEGFPQHTGLSGWTFEGGSLFMFSDVGGGAEAAPAFVALSGGGALDNKLRWVVARATGHAHPVSGITNGWRWEMNEALPGTPGTFYAASFSTLTETGSERTAQAYSRHGVATLASGASSGSASVVLGGGLYVRVGNASPQTWSWNDHRRIFHEGNPVLIHSTVSMSPAAVSNGQTVNTTRTGLARLRVIGNNGTVHATFISGQAAPVGVGCTADLTAGTVTFSDVSGLSQPVTVEHRIEEMAQVDRIEIGSAGATLRLNRTLSRAYPAGTRVSSLLMLGNLQGRTTGVAFAQAAWTGAWADTVSGGTPTADFNLAGNPIVCTNAGAVTERWALIFTNTTSFRIVGEALGEIGTGSTGSPAAPINPATGAPYFTVPAGGWGTGWAAGNVYRFNTAGANAPLWVGRCVAPSAPAGDDHVALQLRGYLNT